MSAAILSPSSSSTTSPGTRLADGTSLTWPPRSTRAAGALVDARAGAFQRLLGARGLHEAQHGVQDDDEQYRDRIAEPPEKRHVGWIGREDRERRGDGSGCEEGEHREVRDLTDEPRPHRRRLGLGQLVPSDSGQAFLGLRDAEPALERGRPVARDLAGLGGVEGAPRRIGRRHRHAHRLHRGQAGGRVIGLRRDHVGESFRAHGCERVT